MKKSNNNMPIVFYVGLLLVCLTFFSVHMSSGLYARYVSQASGSDDARVAKFSVSQDLTVTKNDGDGTTLNAFVVGDELYPGKSTSYTYTVKNDSEVTVKFIVSARELLGDLPIVIGDKELNTDMQDCVSFTLQPGTIGTIKFSVSWPDTKNNVSFGGMISQVEIAVRAEQVD